MSFLEGVEYKENWCQKRSPTEYTIEHFGTIGPDSLRFWSVLEKPELLRNFDWQKIGLIKKQSPQIRPTVNATSRGEATEGGGEEVNLPPGLEV